MLEECARPPKINGGRSMGSHFNVASSLHSYAGKIEYLVYWKLVECVVLSEQ